jgi:hypothetical protein
MAGADSGGEIDSGKVAEVVKFQERDRLLVRVCDWRGYEHRRRVDLSPRPGGPSGDGRT